MSYTEQSAANLMSSSILSGGTVHAAYNSDVAFDLTVESEDGAEHADGTQEFCGTDDAGRAWRVHLHG